MQVRHKRPTCARNCSRCSRVSSSRCASISVTLRQQSWMRVMVRRSARGGASEGAEAWRQGSHAVPRRSGRHWTAAAPACSSRLQQQPANVRYRPAGLHTARAASKTCLLPPHRDSPSLFVEAGLDHEQLHASTQLQQEVMGADAAEHSAVQPAAERYTRLAGCSAGRWLWTLCTVHRGARQQGAAAAAATRNWLLSP